MKTNKILFRTIGILTCVILVCLLALAGFAYHLFSDQIKAVQSIKEVTDELYEMTYYGDYGIDAFLEQGGIRSDAELQPFLQKVLSHGLIPVNTPQPEIPDIGCSTLVAPIKGTSGYLFGRNFDWAKKGNTIIIRTYPKNGYASVSTSNLDFLNMPLSLESDNIIEKMPVIAAIYVALDGINEKGLMVADLFAGDKEKTAQERGNLAVTTTTAIRLLLDLAATTDEAISLLASWDMHSSIYWAHHLAIADKTGYSVVVEWIDNEMIVTPTPAVTNHYLTPLRPHVGIGQTEARRDTLCARLEAIPEMQTSAMKQLLQDVAFEDYTGWSVIFNTTELNATYYFRTDFTKAYIYPIYGHTYIPACGKGYANVPACESISSN
ncbi:MAG: linear amide C-N hydrolase [Paludibacteraceae bacterium]|nr:linear amide C-N hydrolase [Paludibacteraceae bacterium]